MLSDREQRALDELERAYFAEAPRQSHSEQGRSEQSPSAPAGSWRRWLGPSRFSAATLVLLGAVVVVLTIAGAGAAALPLAVAGALGCLLWRSWSWLRGAS